MYKYNFMLSVITPDDHEHVVGGFDSLYYMIKCAYSLPAADCCTYRISPDNICFCTRDVSFETMYNHISDKIFKS